MATFYDILGVSRGADAATIRTAFRELAVKYHPDKNPNDPKAEERFKKINAAYQVLSDPNSRAAYDLSLEDPFRAGSRNNAERRYQERRRSREYQQQYRYKGNYQQAPHYRARRKQQEPPMTPWKAYALVAGAIAVFVVFVLGLMHQLNLYEARNEYEQAHYFWRVVNRPDYARQQLQSAIARDDEYQEAYALFADITIDQGLSAEGLYSARKALELLDEPQAKDYFRLSHCLMAQGKKEEAYYYLRQGIALEAFDEWSLYQLAEIELYTYRRYQAAIAYFNRYLAIKPYQKDALLHKAVAHQQLFAFDSAGVCLQAVLNTEPHNPVARYYYAKNLLSQQDTLNACPMFRYAEAAGVQQAKWYVFNFCSEPDSTNAEAAEEALP